MPERLVLLEVTLGSGERFDGLPVWLAVALPVVIAWGEHHVRTTDASGFVLRDAEATTQLTTETAVRTCP